MDLLKELENNKGLVSTSLAKKISEEILSKNTNLLTQTINIVSSENANVRAGAAKIIELVAIKKPELISKNLKSLLPLLDAEEPQTKWVTIHVFGLCAKLEPKLSKSVITKAKLFLKDKSLCLQDRAITYFGYLGSISSKDASEILPILEDTLTTVPKRIPRAFEGFERMIPVLSQKDKLKLIKIAEKYSQSKTPSIAKYAKKILKKLTSQ